jgi:hypothetical protein
VKVLASTDLAGCLALLYILTPALKTRAHSGSQAAARTRVTFEQSPEGRHHNAEPEEEELWGINFAPIYISDSVAHCHSNTHNR